MLRIIKFLFILSVLFNLSTSKAQRIISLSKAIAIAQKESYAAKMADFSFMSSYWSYRSYKAGWLPSLNLSGTLMNYNRSIVETRDFETGKVAYVDNNSLYNNINLSINQVLPLADGTLSLQSNISRLDQFDYNMKTYNTTPLALRYNQPLRQYSAKKWLKKTAPLEYENAKRSFLESMQGITINVTALYFAALSAQSEYKQCEAKYKDLQDLYTKAEKKHKLGTITKSELLQLELSLLNARMNISKYHLALENSLFNLFSYLRINEYSDIKLLIPSDIPDVMMQLDDVIDKAYQNSSHSTSQRLTLLNAEQNLASTKANTGIQMSLQAQVGLTKSAYGLKDAYQNMLDNEVIGITFSMPIFDWGIGKGKVRMAKAQLELARTQIEQNNLDFKQDIRDKVMQFNNQAEQCRISTRALEIAEERYLITFKRFENGTATVTDLNTATNEFESAQVQFLNQLQIFWYDYYTIQKLTLYDYINRVELMSDFDEIIK